VAGALVYVGGVLLRLAWARARHVGAGRGRHRGRGWRPTHLRTSTEVTGNPRSQSRVGHVDGRIGGNRPESARTIPLGTPLWGVVKCGLSPIESTSYVMLSTLAATLATSLKV